MYRFTLLLCLILLVISGHSQAQTDLSDRATVNMEEGLSVNEALINFLISRPCEFGIVDDCNRPLSIQDIAQLKNLFRKLDAWNKELFGSILPGSDRLKGLPYAHEKGPAFSVKEDTRFNPRLFKNEKYLRIVLNEADEKSNQFMRDIQITSASTLLMYDSLFKLSFVLSKAKKIRSILEYDLGSDVHILRETFSVALDEKVWNSTKNNLDFLEATAPAQLMINYFEQYIAKSFTASKIKDDDFIFRMRSVLFIERILSETQFLNALDKLVQRISQIFGNTVGQVQTRDGKLKVLAKDPVAMDGFKAKLKPLDILLEKTPFRLTDHFIPGHYGHVAIWLGRPEEIVEYKVVYQGQEIFLLDHPLVGKYLEQMSLGKLIVEALREPGVTVNTLEHFMDIDDFLVLRSNRLEDIGGKILRTIEQIGKPYDFNFDVETESSIVCSELVYRVFDDQQWPTDRTMGRYTISPDHVAWKTIDSCLKPIIMFHDGAEVTQNMTGELKLLLEQRGGISYSPVGSCN